MWCFVSSLRVTWMQFVRCDSVRAPESERTLKQLIESMNHLFHLKAKYAHEFISALPGDGGSAGGDTGLALVGNGVLDKNLFVPQTNATGLFSRPPPLALREFPLVAIIGAVPRAPAFD